MKLLILISCCFLSALTFAENLDEWRLWTSAVGSKIEAKLINMNDEFVQLEVKSTGNKIAIKINDLSIQDRILLSEMTQPEEKGDTQIEGLDATPGKISPVIKCLSPQDQQWSYHLYLPKSFHVNRKYPLWVVMSAGGGKNGKGLERYIQGAEEMNSILVIPVESKNGFADSDLAIDATVRDVESRLPIQEDLKFSSGMSGGSRMAYWLAETNSGVKGVLACGSGNGIYLKASEFRDVKLPEETYVYSLMGSACFNRNEAIDSHASFPDHYRLHFFKGNHAWADKSLITKGMRRVYGEALLKNENPEFIHLKKEYAKKTFDLIQEKYADEPWESYHWMRLLSQFKEHFGVQYQAEQLLTQLEADPKVVLGDQAQQAFNDFCLKHYANISYKDMAKANPAREKEATKLAATYAGTPQEPLFSLLALPAKMPKSK